MIEDILVPLVTVGLAELGDKTQVSVILLSSETRRHAHLLAGVMCAFFMVDGFAVLAGSWAANLIPLMLLKMISGWIFVVFGLLMFRKRGDRKRNKFYPSNPFLSGFVMVFLAEWGDKTQVASGLFATKYSAGFVLAGIMLSLGILSLMAVYAGKLISEKIERSILTRIAGLIFVIIGISFFVL